MPYKVNWEKSGVYMKLYGVVGTEDLENLYSDINDDPRFEDVNYQICDFLDMEVMNYSGKEVQKFGHLDKAGSLSNPRVKVALVIRNREAQKLSNIYQAELANTSWDAEVFHTEDDARTWVR